MSTPPSPTFADRIRVPVSPPSRHRNPPNEHSPPPTGVGETPTEFDAIRNQMNLLEIRVEQRLQQGFDHMELSFDTFQAVFNANSTKVDKDFVSLRASNDNL